jgi:hypothetical protein
MSVRFAVTQLNETMNYWKRLFVPSTEMLKLYGFVSHQISNLQTLTCSL